MATASLLVDPTPDDAHGLTAHDQIVLTSFIVWFTYGQWISDVIPKEPSFRAGIIKT